MCNLWLYLFWFLRQNIFQDLFQQLRRHIERGQQRMKCGVFRSFLDVAFRHVLCEGEGDVRSRQSTAVNVSEESHT